MNKKNCTLLQVIALNNKHIINRKQNYEGII